MRERGIIFSGPMVRAILEGRKTQTRRVVKPRNKIEKSYPGDRWWAGPHPVEGWWAVDNPKGPCKKLIEDTLRRKGFPCPYGIPGDRLYVRECWKPTRAYVPARDGVSMPTYIRYRADDSRREVPHNLDGSQNDRWRPSIHMPKWASRIWLEIVGVRVEMVGEISEEDARAEGVDSEPPLAIIQQCAGMLSNLMAPKPRTTAKQNFQTLWGSINGKRPGCAWRDNPFCWVIEFNQTTKG